MEEEFNKSIREMWKKLESSLPGKVNPNDPEYCKIQTTRAVFSSNRKILDIEDIAGNNIRLINEDEADWLIEVLQRYKKEKADG